MNKNKINKTTSAIFVLMLFTSLLFMNPIMPTILSVNAEDEPWLDGWDYRKSHVITGSSYGAVSDYIFAFKVCKGSGTDGTEVYGSTVFGKVYCNDHCRDDFMDVRFTDSDGNSTLAINVMNVTPGDCAYIWVKTSVDAYPANKTIYMYYGNENATSDCSIAEEYFFAEIGDGRTLQGNSTLPTNSTGVVPYDRFSWNTPTIVANNSKSVYWYCNVATNFTGRLTVLEGDGTTMTKWEETPVFSVDSGLTRVADMFDDVQYQMNLTSGWIMGHYGTGGVNAPSVSIDNTSKYYPSGYLPLRSTGNFSADSTFEYWTAVVGCRVVVDPEPTHTLWGEEEALEVPPVYGAFWLEGWSYRKSHVINAAVGAGTNYQVMINVGYGNNTDSGDTVYLNENCQADFDDIRFTDYNGSVLLDYWMETKTDSANATFWVEISEDLGSSDALIYVYYGNSTVSTTSNGADTFVQFDDFTGNSTTMSIYNENPSKIEITHETTYDWLMCTWKTNASYPYVSSHAYWGQVSSGHAMRMSCLRQTPSDLSANKQYSMYFGEDYTKTAPAGDDLAGHNVWSQGDSFPPNRGIDNAYNDANTMSSNVYNVSLDTWDTYEVTWSTTNVTTYLNDTFIWSSQTAICVPDEPLYPMVGGARGANNATANSYAYWDWILIRNFVENEPSHGDWGTEEGQLWLDGWDYRKSHVITNATDAGTNYQVRIFVDYDNDSDSGDTVYVDGKCQADFDDIRFTASDGETELDYWMEEKTDSNAATFWVEIVDNLNNDSATVYVYYGNNGVTTTSNGDNTFILFDHFEGGAIDTDKWNATEPGQFSVANSWVTCTGNGNTPWLLSDNAVPGYNVAIEAELNVVAAGYQGYGSWRTQLMYPIDGCCWFAEGSYDRAVAFNGTASWEPGDNKGMTTGYVRSNVYFTDGKIRWKTEGTRNFDDSWTGTTDNTARSLWCFGSYSTSIIKCDFIFVRNYVEYEPAHGTWGPEESM